VLTAYEWRCAVCGFDVQLGAIPIALDAAHIRWHQANGPDTERNGLALCALHHKTFDLGVFVGMERTRERPTASGRGFPGPAKKRSRKRKSLRKDEARWIHPFEWVCPCFTFGGFRRCHQHRSQSSFAVWTGKRIVRPTAGRTTGGTVEQQGNESDRERRAREQRRQDEQDLFDRYYARLTALVRRRYPHLQFRTPDSLAASALKDGFCGIHAGNLHFAGGDNLLAWLTRVVLNKACRAVRDEKTRKRAGQIRQADLPEDGRPEAADPFPMPDEEAMDDERFRRFFDRLDKEPGLKKVFFRKLQGGPNTQIAKELGMSDDTVARRLRLVEKIGREEADR